MAVAGPGSIWKGPGYRQQPLLRDFSHNLIQEIHPFGPWNSMMLVGRDVIASNMQADRQPPTRREA